MKPLAFITGVGPGTGSSIARRFATAGYRTALLARDAARLNALAAELPDALALPYLARLTTHPMLAAGKGALALAHKASTWHIW